MPCYDPETPAERAAAAKAYADRLTDPLRKENEALTKSLNQRDAMLCGILRAIEEMDAMPFLSLQHDGKSRTLSSAVEDYYDCDEAGINWAAIKLWFADHKRKDEERRAMEAANQLALRERAMAKLTVEEQKALGLLPERKKKKK